MSDRLIGRTLVMACSAIAAVSLGGCKDLKPLQADIDTLKSQVSRLQSDLAATRQ